MAAERGIGKRENGFAPTRVEEVHEVLPTSTEPVKVRTDAGLAYLKHPANRANPQSLACEWLGTRLAQTLGLTTFDTVQLDYDGVAQIVLDHGLAEPGRCFVTRAEKGGTWDETRAGLDGLDRPDDLVRLVVLDTWLRNPDRHIVRRGQPEPNPSNVFISAERGIGMFSCLIAMDFSLLLLPLARGPGVEMPTGTERDPEVYGLFPEFVPYLRRASLEKALGVLAATTHDELLEISAEIPDEWGVDSTVRIETASFLVERATFLRTTLVARLEEEHPTQFGIVEREEDGREDG